jgi:PAS domain S-box-containing protein
MDHDEIANVDLSKLSNEELVSIIYSLRKELTEIKQKSTLADLINDASIDRILAVDVDMRIIAWNKMCEHISGISKEDCIGKDLLDVVPEMTVIPEVTRAIRSALKGYKSFVAAEKGSFNGSYCEHFFAPLVDENKKVIGVLNIIHDVAHRVKVEQELRNLNKALVRKNKELKQKNAELLSFSHVAAHDLKEPLRKIYTFVEMILTKDADNLSETSRVYFKRVQASAQRMGLLTDDILGYTQLSNAEQELEPTDLNEVVEHAVKYLNEIIDNKKAVIKYDTLPVINGYKPMLVQLFENLIHNALKFQQDNVIPVVEIKAVEVSSEDIQHTDVLPDARYWCISFTDNGIGFEMKYLDKVFRIFQKLHPADKYPGTGMGLPICKKVMELHQGFIIVESTPDKGSVFKCYFLIN